MQPSKQLQDSAVENSINHTAFDPLRSFPICLSVETKKYGGDLKKADLQLCSWQAAQWTMLASQAGDAISRLPFLPGIIVQGHEWKFVATTRRNEETELWASASFGSTMTSLGVLQIMTGLNRLRRWSIEVFWPWYKQAPNDDRQQEAEDLMHEVYRIILNNELYEALIGDNPQRVLDLGCGTGIWAIEFADMHLSADVLGVDLSPIQPNYVPPN
ncbi:hypothetical protein NCS52_01520100 [Fusarium sp. LHS14.1]|nr:hypothetical protein NCS52_01520100 [Fusarium sp. LHS14.1]